MRDPPAPNAALPPPVPQTRPQNTVSSSVRSIVDLSKLIDDFLTKIEGALYSPYDLSRAQKDYDSIAGALTIVEKGMEEKDILHVGVRDFIGDAGVGLEDLLKSAVRAKAAIDQDFEKIASAAAAAAAAE